MTELRQRMLEELQRRNFSPHTIRGYIRTVRDFAAYFHKPPDQLGVEEVRQFQLHMLRDQKLATGTVQNRMTALHFFFKRVLKRHDPELYDMALTRRPKKLPVVLSPEEVEKLIEAAPNIRYRMILLLLYSTGLRRTEASQLKLADIDSKRMVIHVHEGKNSRDRELPLTPKLLEALRDILASLQSEAEGLFVPDALQNDRRGAADHRQGGVARLPRECAPGRTLEALWPAHATAYFRDPPHRERDRSADDSAPDGSPKAAGHHVVRAPLPAAPARRRQCGLKHNLAGFKA